MAAMGKRSLEVEVEADGGNHVSIAIIAVSPKVPPRLIQRFSNNDVLSSYKYTKSYMFLQDFHLSAVFCPQGFG